MKSNPIVFSVWYNLEKCFFVTEKKIFWLSGIFLFLGLSRKKQFFWTFSGQERPINKIGTYSESAQRALSIDI
jgi:hypothetical protein